MAYYTFVFEVNDEAAFKPEWDRLHDHFKWEGGLPFRVCAISHGHEMKRLSLIEDALEKHAGNLDLAEIIGEILDCPDPHAFQPEAAA